MTDDARTPTVIVTGVGGGSVGEQILKALRLADTPYRIVGCDAAPWSAGFTQCDVPYVLPSASAPDYVDALLALAHAENARAVFCGSEPELKRLAAARHRFAEAGVFLPVQPDAVLDTCLDKWRTTQFLETHGFAFPRSRVIASREDLAGVTTYPVVVKPSVGGGGSAHVYVAQDATELALYAELLFARHPEFIVQQYVGTADGEFTVGVLLDMEGRLLNSIVIRRHILGGLSNRIRVPNRSGDASLGAELVVSNGISQGEIGDFPAVAAVCERLALELGARGAINVQCRVHEGEVYVFEVNPRFSGTTSLRALAGYNEPDVLFRTTVRGESVPARFPYRRGRIARALHEVFVQDGGVPRAADLRTN